MSESVETPVRSDTFTVDGTLELDLTVLLGKVEVELTETTEAWVEVRHDPGAQEVWAENVTNVLNWVSERFGGQFGSDFRGSPAEAVNATKIEKTGNRITVRAPKTLPLRNIPLAVTVHAPSGSQLEIRAGSADVTVTGTAGRAGISTGSGEVRLDRTDGTANVRTGSGAIRLGPAISGLQVRTGSGDVEAASLSGSATVTTGTGDIWFGEVSGEVMARSGSGDLSVAEAAGGSLELITGSGEVRIGIRTGVHAEIDLSSTSGKVSSELDVETEAPSDGVALRLRARTGSGNAVLTRAGQ
ncbi:DUF4097 family beta strand repeat-containing protein [Amycolatopsis minnesotensis]|uniref:DUF4097 family beta strand repeat-containing protein n=1 Tax=Amycolatopsis minnesotensis TaxID=337894 RepID=A0ABN2Q434_9PSEU